MTSAFDIFMFEHNRSGSEKADGYSPAAFDGLADSEKDIVFKLLENELPFSAEWLVLVDPHRAVTVLENEEKRIRGNRYDDVYKLQEYLVKYTGDLLYQQHMIEDYPSYIENLKPLVVDSIGRTPANAATVAFFKQVILTETNSSAIARAARRLLAAVNFQRETEKDEVNYKRIIRELTGGSFEAKVRLLSQIGS